MINVENFIKRLEAILDYYSLSASAFADALGVQRSGLSHLMSGRNKPSLDLIMKISETYPEVDLYWLIKGTGTFPAIKENVKGFNFTTAAPTITTQQKNTLPDQGPDLFSSVENTEANNAQKEVQEFINLSSNDYNEVDRIVLFYKDGTFKSYIPGK